MLHQIPALESWYDCKSILLLCKRDMIIIHELASNSYVECSNIKYVVCIYRLIKKCKQMMNVGTNGVAWP